MAKFFWSDQHIGHANILKYCRDTRPWTTVEEMDAALAQAWDTVVKPGDEVYLGGDVAMNPKIGAEWLRRRPGQKFLVWGNHDGKPKKPESRRPLVEACVKTGDVLEVSERRPDGTKQKIVLCHFPMLRWNLSHHGSWMLHGHTHGDLSYPYPMKIQDVGVDCFPHGPVRFDKLEQIMAPLPTIHHHKDED